MMWPAKSYSASYLVNAKIKNPLISNSMLIFYESSNFLLFFFFKSRSHNRSPVSTTFSIINIIIYKMQSAFEKTIASIFCDLYFLVWLSWHWEFIPQLDRQDGVGDRGEMQRGRANTFNSFSVAGNHISLTNSFCSHHSSMSSLNVNGNSKSHNFQIS